MGVLLAGIVATQVEVLKVGASMGRWVSRTAALTSRNQALQASVAALSDDQRIERLAAQMGMVMPAPADVNFIALHPAGGIKAAIGRIHVPDAAEFLAALSASQADALAQTAPAVPAPPSTTTTTSTSSVAAAPGAAGSSTAVLPSTTTQGTTTVAAAPGSTQSTTGAAVTSTQPTAPSTGSTGGATLPSGEASQTGG
jgi:hypothetical protein